MVTQFTTITKPMKASNCRDFTNRTSLGKCRSPSVEPKDPECLRLLRAGAAAVPRNVSRSMSEDSGSKSTFLGGVLDLMAGLQDEQGVLSTDLSSDPGEDEAKMLFEGERRERLTVAATAAIVGLSKGTEVGSPGMHHSWMTQLRRENT
mmetsp:Transcript_19959/g.36720  ORF Transcript_19959/g.36720 Transcript_19959/m.36720 type:complete len:149 (-) Transcript_19959:7-453(-)